MNQGRTTNFIVQTEDHFVADLDNGGVRIGMKGFAAVDFPATHVEYDRVRALTAAAVEGAFDAYYLRTCPVQTDGYRDA
jgi:hypothetical protein